jgi:5-methylthioadenosine/S-adenosylhomocysteine deaminase
VGSLEPGKRADVIAVRTGTPRLLPWHDPVANLVYGARGSDVVAVYVDGRPLVRGGRALHLDVEQVLADAVQATERLIDARR